MADIPSIIYIPARGRAEIIRLTLAATGMESAVLFTCRSTGGAVQLEAAVLLFSCAQKHAKTCRPIGDSVLLEFKHGPMVDTPEKFRQLKADHLLQFDQLPLVEYKGMHMVQSTTTAQCSLLFEQTRYFAQINGILGNAPEERFRICALAEGAIDFNQTFNRRFIDSEAVSQKNIEKSCNRYLPKFEKVLEGSASGWIFGDKMTFADVALLLALLHVQELTPQHLKEYPKCQAHLTKMTAIPSIKKYLESDQRIPANSAERIKIVINALSD